MTSSPDPFKYFNLDRATSTESDLKKAYAQKLKSIRPEDDREGFMTLRQCFESAKRQIFWRDEDAAYEAAETQEADTDAEDGQASAESSSPSVPEPPLVQEKFNPVVHDQWHDTPVSPTEEPESQTDVTMAPKAQAHPVDTAMDDITALVASPFAGGSFAPWQAIIEREELQTIDNYQIFSDRLRSFICEETGLYDELDEQDNAPMMRFPSWLSVPVLKGLGDTFGWHKQHSRQYWIRSENDWIAKLGIEYAKPGDPAERQAERAKSINRVMGPDGTRGGNNPHSSGGQIYSDKKRNVMIYWGWIALRLAFFGFIFYSIFRD